MPSQWIPSREIYDHVQIGEKFIAEYDNGESDTLILERHGYVHTQKHLVIGLLKVKRFIPYPTDRDPARPRPHLIGRNRP